MPQLLAALERLPVGPAVDVAVGAVPGFFELRPDGLVLSEGLMGPAMHHPDEPAGAMRLDRWRRATAAVLQGVAVAALRDRLPDDAPLDDWRALGAAAEIADMACPELQLGVPDLILAAAMANPGSDPRQGIAVFRACRRLGADPWSTALNWLGGSGPTAERWLELGHWILGKELAAEVGMAVQSAPRLDVPLVMGPWSWARIEVPAHPRGGWVRADGDAMIEQAWAAGGRPLRTLAGALAQGGSLTPISAGPIGKWEHVSARGWGQHFGIRGMQWTFYDDGRMQMVLADSLAGPVDARTIAEGIGTSGIVPGRWAIAGDQRLVLSDLVTSRLSMHGKGPDSFVLPAGGLSQVLSAMQGGVWRWRQDRGELFLTGPLMGGEVELRFRPADGA